MQRNVHFRVEIEFSSALISHFVACDPVVVQNELCLVRWKLYLVQWTHWTIWCHSPGVA